MIRRIISILIIILALVVTTFAQVKLYHANVQHGTFTNGVTTPGLAAGDITTGGTDVAGLNEVSTGDLGNWDTAFTSNGFTRAIYDEHPAGGDGNAIYYKSSTITLINTWAHDLEPTSGSPILGWNGNDVRRSTVAGKFSKGGFEFYVVSFHACAALCEDNSSTNFAATRVTQINDLISWINSTLTGAPVWILTDANMPANYPRAPERTFTADSSTDILTSTSHGFIDGTAVVLRTSGTIPAGLVTGDSLYAAATVYYIRDSTSNTFKLASTLGGTAINITSNGSGSNFVSATQLDLFLQAGYTDFWHYGINNTLATANWGDRDTDSIPDMPLNFTTQTTRTHDSRIIDYILGKGTGFTLTNIDLPDLRDTCSVALTTGGNFKQCPDVTTLIDFPEDQGIRPSDHNFLSATFSIQSFDPPSNLVAINGSGNNITLNWFDHSSTETQFKIERKLGTGGTYSQIDTVSSNITTYSDTSTKTDNRPYIYRVRAFNGTTNTAYSNEDDATTPFTCTGGIKTDNAAYLETPTSMPLPLAGGYFYDETFCTKIIRVTDESDGLSFGTNYSVWRTANSDNTKLFAFNFFNNSYHIVPWNPTTSTRNGAITQIANAPALLFAHYESANWSKTDPDKLYISVDAKLYYYRPSTDSYTLIKDLTSSFPVGYYFIQLYVSDDENRFGVMIRNSSSDQGFIVYELSTDTLKLDIRTTDMNGITMDKSGNYVLYVPDTPFGTQKIYNVNTGTFEGLESDSGTGLPDYQIGHNDTGNDLVVSDDQWRGGFTSRAMSSPHSITLAYQYSPFWISHHISLRANNDNWALVSTYGEVSVSSDVTRFRRELFQVGVKGTATGQLRRLAHNRSNWRIGGVKTVTNATNASPIVITSTAHGFETGQRPQMSGIGGNTAANGTFFITVIDANTFSLNGSTGNGTYTSGGQAYVETYWDTPRANPSLDGRYIFYTSNNNGVPGGSRNDLFAAEITPAADGIKKCNWNSNPRCTQ